MESNTLRVAGIVDESIVDGHGFPLYRVVQELPASLPGLHNPQTHPFPGGKGKRWKGSLLLSVKTRFLKGDHL